jgi:glycosyltransferase involved in cell wall biosynthesis
VLFRSPDRFVVIPNGFDTRTFRPDVEARLALRQELRLNPDALLIGLAARFDPTKDHDNFLRAAAILAHAFPNVGFVLCGANIDAHNVALVQQIASLGLTQRCYLLGRRPDMPGIHAAMDLATSSSLSEAFPLAIGEAMACGVPCVATDVGDSALIVGPTGRIVPPREPAALAAAWSGLLAAGPTARQRLGRDARRRIEDMFELGTITRRYEALYESIASNQGDRRSSHRHVAEPVGSAAA